MPHDPRLLHRRLVQRLVSGEGTSSTEDRRNAFDAADLPEPLRSMLTEVATGCGHLTDRDVEQAKAAGFTEDQIFELVVCAAVGAATRQYETGLEALARARSNGGDR